MWNTDAERKRPTQLDEVVPFNRVIFRMAPCRAGYLFFQDQIIFPMYLLSIVLSV